jgi:hypothetical protein
MASFKHMTSSRFHLELALQLDQLSNHFFFLHNDDVLKIHNLILQDTLDIGSTLL